MCPFIYRLPLVFKTIFVTYRKMTNFMLLFFYNFYIRYTRL